MKKKAKPKAKAKAGWNPKQFKKANAQGNSKQWKEAAKALNGTAHEVSEDLRILDLVELPKTKRDLVAARNKRLRNAHPDHGGSDKAAREIIDAYQRLLEDL